MNGYLVALPIYFSKLNEFTFVCLNFITKSYQLDTYTTSHLKKKKKIAAN